MRDFCVGRWRFDNSERNLIGGRTQRATKACLKKERLSRWPADSNKKHEGTHTLTVCFFDRGQQKKDTKKMTKYYGHLMKPQTHMRTYHDAKKPQIKSIQTNEEYALTCAIR